jgi:hypothetical protein
VTENLLPPFSPTTDQAWLTINGTGNGVVSFICGATSCPRVANLTLLGQTIPVTQTIAPTLTGLTILADGSIQFAFSNNFAGASFSILSSTNLLLPMTAWDVIGVQTNVAPGLYQFAAPTTTNAPERFYRVRSP